VLVWEYVILARENRAEEHSPWASIIVKEPYQPQRLVVRRAAVKRAICPTEE
jgi:hypothetical protein